MLKGAVLVAAVLVTACACSKSSSPPAGTPAPAASAASAAPAPKEMSPGAATGAPMLAGAAGATSAAAGPKVLGNGFSLEAIPPADGAVGAAAQTTILIKPSGVFHLNKDFPTSITVTPPDGVDVTKGVLAATDAASFTEKEAKFEVAYTPRAAGAKKFTAQVKFAVCTEATCDPKRETLAWEVPVK